MEDVEAWENGPGPDRQARGVLGMGLDIFRTDSVVVRHSYFHDGVGDGILIVDCTNALVENNTITNSELDAAGEYWDGGIWIDGGHDVVVRGNRIEGNHGPGITLSDEAVQHPTGYVVENNELLNNLWGLYIWNFGVCPGPSEDILRISGNTLTGNSRAERLCHEWECGVGRACD